MRRLHVIMPMAGEGSRFVRQGYRIPKPLVQVEGKPLFVRAIQSVDGIESERHYSLIVRQEHICEYGIDAEIVRDIPDSRVLSVTQTTRGAVETCLLAQEDIADDDAVLLLDCDLEFYSAAFNSAIREILTRPATVADGGVLLSFDADNPRYSYALTDGDGRVIRTAEKKVISNDALAGAYFFSTGRSFLASATRLLDDADRQESELYVSLLYNYLIEAGETVRLVKTEKYRSFGTPEELRQYAKSDRPHSD